MMTLAIRKNSPSVAHVELPSMTMLNPSNGLIFVGRECDRHGEIRSVSQIRRRLSIMTFRPSCSGGSLFKIVNLKMSDNKIKVVKPNYCYAFLQNFSREFTSIRNAFPC